MGASLSDPEAVEGLSLVLRDYGNGIRESTLTRKRCQSEPSPEKAPRKPAQEFQWVKRYPAPEDFPPDASPWWVARCVRDGQWVKVPLAPGEPSPSSVRRSKRLLRRQACALGLSRVMTLTYRDNMQDRDRAVRDCKEFHRRLGRVVPSWVARSVIEVQKRGALHLHCLVRELPPWLAVTDPVTGVTSLVRSYAFCNRLWQSVSGGGNVDQGEYVRLKDGRRVRRKHSGSPLKAVSYACKYVGKALIEANALGDRRFLRFGKAPHPRVVRQFYLAADSILALAEADRFHHCAAERREFFDAAAGVAWALTFHPPPS